MLLRYLYGGNLAGAMVRESLNSESSTLKNDVSVQETNLYDAHESDNSSEPSNNDSYDSSDSSFSESYDSSSSSDSDGGDCGGGGCD